VLRRLARVPALVSHLIGWPLLVCAALSRRDRPQPNALLELLDTWALYLLAPWPLLGLLAWLRRSAALGLLTAIGSVQALQVARLTVGQGRRPGPVSGLRLRVMTANVLAPNRDAGALAELIRSEQPDLVAFQEIRTDFGADLEARLGSLLPYAQISPHARFGGAALFSRWPLDGLETFKLSERGHFCQHARVLVAGQPLHFLNIHLQTPFEVLRRRRGLVRVGIRHRTESARDDEVERLLGMVEKLDEAVVVAGDFNSSAGSRPHRRLLTVLQDAFREVGRGLGHTFPQAVSVNGLFCPVPLLRIDYLFFRGPVRPLSARTVHQPGSDHRSVIADFDLLGATPCGAGKTERSGSPLSREP
jgi:endonuclease/exonuclease/phosphatase (EEP) superfamily protein YafD